MANETLYCNSFDSTDVDWTEVGANPYLNDNDANSINSWADARAESYFGFANSGVGAGVINSVTLYLEAMTAHANNPLVNVKIDVGGGDVDFGNITCDAGAYGWEPKDVSATVDTWAKIDACELKLTIVASGFQRDVRRAYLLVDYTPAGGVSIPVAMHHYGHHISKIIRG